MITNQSTNPSLTGKSIEEHISAIKTQKEKEVKEAQGKLKTHTMRMEELNYKANRLLSQLFTTKSQDIGNLSKVIEELKLFSDKRIKIRMSMYKWETKLNQLKYI